MQHAFITTFFYIEQSLWNEKGKMTELYKHHQTSDSLKTMI